MHIPDGFLSPPVIAATSTVGGLTVALSAVRLRLQKSRPASKSLQTASLAALIFSAQMLNFPISGGTSGHLLGGLLAAALLGPASALLVITSILITQCLLFADGGITALGANILNMGLIGTLGGYAIYRGLHDLLPGKFGNALALAVAAWTSVLLAALACAIELILSGTASARLALPAMLESHAQIAVGEALITLVGVWALRLRTAPHLAPTQPAVSLRLASILAVLLALASPLACAWPDGLDHTAEALGFSALASTHLHSPLAEYTLPGIHNPAAATIFAALIGAAAVFALVVAITRALRPAPR